MFPPCPAGYRPFEYGSYYPVLGATHARIRQVTDDQPVYTEKTFEHVNRSGYAVRKIDGSGALVFSGGATYSAIDGNSTLTLYGSGHEKSPGAFSMVAYNRLDPDEPFQLAVSTGTEPVGNLVWTGPTVTGYGFAKSSMPKYDRNEAIDLKHTFTYCKTGTFISDEDMQHLDVSRLSADATPHDGDDVVRDIGIALANGASVDADAGDTIRIYHFRAPKTGWLVFFNSLSAGSSITMTVRDPSVGAIVYATMATGVGSGKQVGLTVPCPEGYIVDSWIYGSAMEHGYDWDAAKGTYKGVCRFVRTFADRHRDLPEQRNALRLMMKAAPDAAAVAAQNDAIVIPPAVDTKPSIEGFVGF